MDGTTATALASGSLVLRDLLTINGWDGDGDATQWGYWTGESNVSITVETAAGGTESRNFVGGAGLEVEPVVDGIGLDVRTCRVTLSHLHTTVENMARGGRLRLAGVEVHRAVFSPTTRAIVSTAYLRFIGIVWEASVETPAEGGEGALTLIVAPDSATLTKINPAMKSHEQQVLRSGDRFRRYSDTAAQVPWWWGVSKA